MDKVQKHNSFNTEANFNNFILVLRHAFGILYGVSDSLNHTTLSVCLRLFNDAA
jgi:hypothetical protein